MDKTKKNTEQSIFEQIKKIDEQGSEYWSARDISKILEYKKWDKFLNVIEKAKEACQKSQQRLTDHFVQVGKMVQIGSGAKRTLNDFNLTRYACYLIIQNADPKKEVVALGQTYFAVQTRLQEISQMNDYKQLTNEEEQRFFLRNQLKKHNIDLAQAAKKAGLHSPLDYAIFQNHGYKGLYGGLDAKGIHAKKGLKKSHKILDYMGSTELAANLFRATQAEDKLRRENITGKDKANETHFEVGKKVRQTIEELGGTMPENLPLSGSFKKLARKVKSTNSIKNIAN